MISQWVFCRLKLTFCSKHCCAKVQPQRADMWLEIWSWFYRLKIKTFLIFVSLFKNMETFVSDLTENGSHNCPQFRELNLTSQRITDETFASIVCLTYCLLQQGLCGIFLSQENTLYLTEGDKPFTAASWLVFIVNEAWRVLGKVEHSLKPAFAVRNGHCAATTQGRTFLQI